MYFKKSSWNQFKYILFRLLSFYNNLSIRFVFRLFFYYFMIYNYLLIYVYRQNRNHKEKSISWQRFDENVPPIWRTFYCFILFIFGIDYKMTSVTRYFNIYDSKIFLGSYFSARKHEVPMAIWRHPSRVFLPFRHTTASYRPSFTIFFIFVYLNSQHQ